MVSITDIKKEILNAIDIMVEQKIHSLQFDKTIKGVVVEVLEDNYYNIQIQGNIYKLKYTKEILKKYSSVYVLIPNKNYKNIFILCKVEN